MKQAFKAENSLQCNRTHVSLERKGAVHYFNDNRSLGKGIENNFKTTAQRRFQKELIHSSRVLQMTRLIDSLHPSSKPRSYGPNQSAIQRMTYTDLDQTVRNSYQSDNLTLQDILRAATEWENEESNPLLKKYRKCQAHKMINQYFKDNYDDMNDPQERSELLIQLEWNVGQYLTELEESITFFEAFREKILPNDKFRASAFEKWKDYTRQLNQEQQITILGAIKKAAPLQIAHTLPFFGHIFPDTHLKIALLERLVEKIGFTRLNPAEQQEQLKGFFGPQGQDSEELDLVVKTNPSLALTLVPGLFVTDNHEKDLDQGRLGSVFPHEDFQAIFSKINKVPPDAKTKLLQSFGRFGFRSNLSAENLPKIQKTLDAILSYPNPAAKVELFDSLGTVVKQEGFQGAGVSEVEESNPNILPICLLLSGIFPGYSEKEAVKNYLFKKPKNFKNKDNVHAIVNALLAVKRAPLDNSEDKKDSVASVFQQSKEKNKSFNEFVSNLRYMATYINLGKQLWRVQDFTEFESLVKEGFKEPLGFKEDKLTSEAIENLSGHLRNIGDVLTYAGSLNTLPEDERLPALKNLKHYTKSLFADNSGEAFKQLRYGEKDHLQGPQWEHLEQVFSNPRLALEWKAGTLEPAFFEDKKRRYSVHDTDNPSDLLLLGTDLDTCQSITNNGLNKCLLSYLIDGKNRAIVIKLADPKLQPKAQQIVARSVFRLLTDQSGELLLYLEKPYVNKRYLTNPLAIEHIKDMAHKRAAQLGAYARVHLLANKNEGYKSKLPEHSGDLKSLGGPAVYDYVDSLGSPQTSNYTIPKESTVKLGIYEPVL